MTVETVNLNELSNDPANVRQHSERNVGTVMASLRRFGQQVPLIADANNVVRVGNCRLEAMRRLGWATALIVRTALTGAELAAYAVADNRSGDPAVGSTSDEAALADVLTALRAEDETLVADAGYTLDELAALIGGTDDSTEEEPPAEFPEHGEDIDVEHQCPRCSFRWSGDSSPQEVA